MATSQTGYKDAQRYNESERNSRTYSDIDLFFNKKTDADVSSIKNIQAVKRSIRHLVLYNQFEKPFQPTFFSGVTGLLFENMTPVVANVLARKIDEIIKNYEPRAKVQQVQVIPDFDRNAYEVSLYFYVTNTPTELQELSLLLERIR